MSEVHVQVVDRTNGEEAIGTYRAVAAPRIGELVAIQTFDGDTDVRVVRIEDVHWMAMPAHDVRAANYGTGTFKVGPVSDVTVFGRVAEGPWEP